MSIVLIKRFRELKKCIRNAAEPNEKMRRNEPKDISHLVAQAPVQACVVRFKVALTSIRVRLVTVSSRVPLAVRAPRQRTAKIRSCAKEWQDSTQVQVSDRHRGNQNAPINSFALPIAAANATP
jgi:hypothetical protein